MASVQTLEVIKEWGLIFGAVLLQKQHGHGEHDGRKYRPAASTISVCCLLTGVMALQAWVQPQGSSPP
jgi:hypothetical protein